MSFSPPLRVVLVWLVVLPLAGLAACGTGSRGGTGASQARAARLDDFGDTIRDMPVPRRIVSLSPVTTEMLFALGAGSRVVGRTHWDLYPAAARAVPDLGDGMQPNVEAVIGAHPDLVVLYASPSNRSAAVRFRAAGIATIALRDDRVADFRRTLAMLASAIGDTAAGRVIADSVERSLDAVRAMPRPAHPVTVFWHVWDSPVITIGAGSYLDELVRIAGATNVFGDLAEPSPRVTLEEIVRRNPEFVLVGPAGAAAVRASPLWRTVPAVRAGRLLVVDTTLVGRPGPRLGEAARNLRALMFHDTIR